MLKTDFIFSQVLIIIIIIYYYWIQLFGGYNSSFPLICYDKIII